MDGYFEKEFVLTPDYCDARAGLSPYGAFTIFQAIATEHAERIGVGGAAMAKRGEFWLTVHSRVDFVGRAHLMQTLNAKTWPEPCDETSIRCFRSYSLNCGDTPVAPGSPASRAISHSPGKQASQPPRSASATILRPRILCAPIPSVRRISTSDSI